MRDEEDLDFADDDFDPLLDDFDEELEEEAGGLPQPSAPMSRQEIDSVVDQVLSEELSRLKPGRKPEG